MANWHATEYDNYKEALAGFNAISATATDARLVVVAEGTLYVVTYFL
jgi:hypothetical protein